MFTTKHSPLTKLIIGEKVSTAKGYGSVTKIAHLHKISRSSCYNYRQYYRLVMDNVALIGQSKPSPVRQEKARLILQEYLLHHSSVHGIVKSLRYRAIGIGKGEVSATIGRYGSCLAVYDVIPEDSYVCLAIDETFSGGTPYLAMIDSRTGYLVGLMKAANRQSDTWSHYIQAILGNKAVKSICADFARQIRSCLAGLDLVFHGDLFHYYRVMGRELVQLMNKFKHAFSNWEKAEKALHQAQKAFDEQLIPTVAHKKAVQTAIKAVQTAYNQANVAMQHYDNAQFLLLQSKDAFTYFDEQGNWISHQQAQQLLQTVCLLLREIPDPKLQKAVNFFEKHLPAATQYIADIQAEIIHLINPQTDSEDPNIIFLWQVAAYICRHRHNARCCKQYQQQVYHQQQADQWEAMLCQHTGKQRAQAMLQNLQSLLTKSNRSSSMIETANSRLKPFLRAARGQISQERLNLIRHYLNHCPYERSRVHDRRGFSPYQLFYQKKEDKRNWYTILFEDFLNKSA